jgi:hypothetical protein
METIENVNVLSNDLKNEISTVKTIAELYEAAEIINPQFMFLDFKEKGQTFIGIYKGKSFLDKLNKEFAVFIGGDGVYYLSSNHNLMNLPDNIIGKPIRLTYLGERTFKKGSDVKKVKLFSVITLK